MRPARLNTLKQDNRKAFAPVQKYMQKKYFRKNNIWLHVNIIKMSKVGALGLESHTT